MSKLATLLALFIFCSFISATFGVRNFLKPVKCEDDDRKVETCSTLNSPVCGYNPSMKCVQAPCPTRVTYNSACEACQKEAVISYTKGKCPNDRK